MERALPPLSYTILPLTHDPWPHNADDLSTSSSSATHITSHSTSLLLKALLAIAVLVMIIVTVVGNALVCLAVVLVRKLKQPANFLIVSLAIADFFVGMLVMPLALVDLLFPEWPLGRSMCKLWTTADLTLCTASIVSLCAISVDRYLVITRPLRYSAMRTTARMLVYIAIVWVIAAVVSVSSHIIANLLDTQETDDRICQLFLANFFYAMKFMRSRIFINWNCTDSGGTIDVDRETSPHVIQHFAYQIYATIISFYGPTLIMLILYVQIWRAAKRIARKDHDQTTHMQVGVDKNGNDHLDLIPETQKTLKIVKNDHRGYLHRPSALFHAVKMPLSFRYESLFIASGFFTKENGMRMREARFLVVFCFGISKYFKSSTK
ncbi:7 transmembrane receptor [Ancylostoma ceylanicum]|uniref:7 transmembrane receptor n=1 Tax=Ancylostoma ceylanicum TaxID=53326 RepID=A0A0D6M7P5_9BILA|nr:7 transmembrane receptor [Ancylostoma ceylanicum]